MMANHETTGGPIQPILPMAASDHPLSMSIQLNNGRVFLVGLVHSMLSHAPIMQSFDLTAHIEETVRRVIREELDRAVQEVKKQAGMDDKWR